MKKIFIIFSVFLAVIFIWIINAIPIFHNFSNELEVYDKYSSIGQIISTTNSGYKLLLNKCGEGVMIEKEEVNGLIEQLDIEIKIKETFEEGTSVYGFSKKIKYKINFRGEIINIHIHYGKDKIKIGSPIIFGSF